ncbi:hypothetical protein BIT28_09480 [Photobacterium proteolyticum]|uniref:Flavin reductase like domain-containing protein n=2 Tax=Photobacterium proteolyticum TaxID=1903952 RepID=A0A1Q9H1X9_9GAMM|nr:hypothetical protein BIT28_09480 [Photobacterium proteolyticum]
MQFATRGANKFSQLDCSPNKDQFGPSVPNATAILNCETYQRITVGDHLMLVGKVHQYKQFDRPPLVFEKGRFTSITNDQAAISQTAA